MELAKKGISAKTPVQQNRKEDVKTKVPPTGDVPKSQTDSNI